MQISLRWMLALVTGMFLALSILIWVVQESTLGTDDGHAEWDVTRMVIAHMEQNEGSWPQNWDSLKPQYTTGNGWSFSFHEYPWRVEIDFGANAGHLNPAPTILTIQHFP